MRNWELILEADGSFWDKTKNYASDKYNAVKGFGSNQVNKVTGSGVGKFVGNPVNKVTSSGLGKKVGGFYDKHLNIKGKNRIKPEFGLWL